jgi:raffinose/stachyose/melibiose transport system permease protein
MCIVTPLMLLAPSFAVLAFVFGYPLIRVVRDSLYYPAVGGDKFGLRNYQFVLKDPLFWQSARNNLFFVVVGVPIVTALALLFAVLIFDRLRGWRLYRTLVFMPYILAVPVVGLTFSYLYSFNGAFNSMLRGVGLDSLAQDWLGSQHLVVPSILSVIIFREFGFGTILFLARMSSINEDLFDAAKLDGANWFQRLRYVIIPELGTVLRFFVVVEVTSMVTYVFSYVYSMTQGGPGNKSSIIELYIYKDAFAYRAVGMASAAAVLLFGGAILLILAQFAVKRRREV